MSTTYVFPQRAESLPVLRAGRRAVNPADATARFLLGSLYLSGGLADRALAEWDEARRLDPTRPVLHRNLGLTLLHARGDPRRRARCWRRVLEADPANPQVYLALDQVLGLLGRPPAERVAALEPLTRTRSAARALVFKLALVLVGSRDASTRPRACSRGRFFAREEFGTNVRAVWVEVRLARALASARTGDTREALAVAESLARPKDALPFTKDGLFAFVDEPRFQYRLGELYALCHAAEPARAAWTKAAAAGDDFPFLGPVYAWRAARRLGSVDEAQWRDRLQRSLEAIDTRLVVGTNYPGLLAAARGLTLESLGRVAEARSEIDRALLLPDKRLAHRIALETEKPLPKEASR